MKVASGDFCAYMFTGPNGRRLCTETVTHIKVRPLGDVKKEEGNIAVRNCFSGLRYLMMPILYEGDLLGRIIFGPFMPEEVGDLGEDLKSLEGEFDVHKDYLKTILEKGESLLRLISSILDLSRIEARGVQLVRKPTVLDDVVQSAMESVLPQSLKKNLQLTSNVSPAVQKVVVDSDK